MDPRIPGSVVAVTGGSGFIGSRLVERVLEQGAARVVIIDRIAERPVDAGPLDPRVTHHTLDLSKATAFDLHSALGGVRWLFHLAAEKHSEARGRSEDILATNVRGTHVLYEAAREIGVEKIVFASSLYAYGRATGGPLVESEMPTPTTVYGISKLAGEHLGARILEEGGPDFVALRYFFVYGPRQGALHGRRSLIVKTFDRLSRGEHPILLGDGAQALDYVYIDDVVDATLRALSATTPDGPVNVGSGEALSIRELVARMQRVAGTSLLPSFAPPDSTAGTRRVASLARAREVLDWGRSVALDDGLARTWEWVKARARG
jgi:UDP-glucose 4-epimerase